MDRVPNVIGRYEQRPSTTRTTKNKQIDTHGKGLPEKKSGSQTDTVSLSDNARQVQTIQTALLSDQNDSFQVDRTKGVEKIKKLVEDGKYEVDFDGIAEKMLDSVYGSIEK